MANIRGKLIITVILAVVVLAGLGLYADVGKLLATLSGFRWELLPVILGLTTFNYLLRFVKWEFYLSRLKITLHWLDSAVIFWAGLSMAVTPGKVGELLKVYLLRQRTGVPVMRSAPIIFAERLSDAIAMLLLASTGLLVFDFGWEALGGVIGGVVVVIGIIQSRTISLWLLSFGEKLPVVKNVMHHLHELYESAYLLLRWQNLGFAVLLGFVSWSGECVAFALVLVGLGEPWSFTLLLKATSILALSTLIGSASGLPGGLGAAEGTSTVLLKNVIKLSNANAAAATLLIRLCTLWFGVILGVLGLLLFRRRFDAAAVPGDVPA